MKLVNMTPHAINIFTEDQVDLSNPRRVFIDGEQTPMKVIEPSGMIANVQLEYISNGEVDGIPLKAHKVMGIDNPFKMCPEADYIIVSALFKAKFIEQYGAAVSEKLLTVGQVIYNNPENPRPCGCLGLVS